MRFWNAQAINVPCSWNLLRLGGTWIWVQLNRQEWFLLISVSWFKCSVSNIFDVMLNYSKHYLCVIIIIIMALIFVFNVLIYVRAHLHTIFGQNNLIFLWNQPFVFHIYLVPKFNSIIPPTQLYFQCSISYEITILI